MVILKSLFESTPPNPMRQNFQKQPEQPKIRITQNQQQVILVDSRWFICMGGSQLNWQKTHAPLPTTTITLRQNQTDWHGSGWFHLL